MDVHKLSREQEDAFDEDGVLRDGRIVHFRVPMLLMDSATVADAKTRANDAYQQYKCELQYGARGSRSVTPQPTRFDDVEAAKAAAQTAYTQHKRQLSDAWKGPTE